VAAAVLTETALGGVDPSLDDDVVMVCAEAPVNGDIVPNAIGTAVTTVAATRRAPRRDGMLMNNFSQVPKYCWVPA
jgi:hypothetical protein